MQFRFILILAFSIIIALFTAQNLGPVDVNVFLWKIPQVSLAAIILFCIALGALVMGLLNAVSAIRRARQVHTLQIKELEQKLPKPAETTAPKVEPVGEAKPADVAAPLESNVSEV
jgi:uncharacterized integral membrane protein